MVIPSAGRTNSQEEMVFHVVKGSVSCRTLVSSGTSAVVQVNVNGRTLLDQHEVVLTKNVVLKENI